MFSLLQMSERDSRKPLRDLVRFFPSHCSRPRGGGSAFDVPKVLFSQTLKAEDEKEGWGICWQERDSKGPLCHVIYSQNGKKAPPSF